MKTIWARNLIILGLQIQHFVVFLIRGERDTFQTTKCLYQYPDIKGVANVPKLFCIKTELQEENIKTDFSETGCEVQD